MNNAILTQVAQISYSNILDQTLCRARTELECIYSILIPRQSWLYVFSLSNISEISGCSKWQAVLLGAWLITCLSDVRGAGGGEGNKAHLINVLNTGIYQGLDCFPSSSAALLPCWWFAGRWLEAFPITTDLQHTLFCSHKCFLKLFNADLRTLNTATFPLW